MVTAGAAMDLTVLRLCFYLLMSEESVMFYDVYVL